MRFDYLYHDTVICLIQILGYLFHQCEFIGYFCSKNHTRAVLLRVRPRFFDQVGHETMHASSGNQHFFTRSYHCTEVGFSFFLSTLFIILVGLMMAGFSEKMLISTRCMHGFMSKLIKKSWKDFKQHTSQRYSGIRMHLR